MTRHLPNALATLIETRGVERSLVPWFVEIFELALQGAYFGAGQLRFLGDFARIRFRWGYLATFRLGYVVFKHSNHRAALAALWPVWAKVGESDTKERTRMEIKT